MKRIKLIVISILILSFGIYIYTGICAERKLSPKDDLYKELELFSDVVSIVRSDYVEEADSKKLIYGALRGMLESLDPHSQFLDPDTYNEMKVETEGEFGGIGIEITKKDDLLTIIAPIEDTPAFKVGLKAGDRIVKINGEITRELTLIEAVRRLRGKPGTNVTVTVLREGEQKLLDFTITRDIIKIQSVKVAKIIEQNLGYIRLIEFQENTSGDMERHLVELEKQGMVGLILDLRNNPGGLLDAAVEVSGKLLEEGSLIVSTKGRIVSQNIEYRARRGTKHTKFPLVVLVNKGSASGSEIIAGAILDNKRGIILGEKTFGKGSVQTVVPLSDGSAVRLTTSKYFTPSGRSIHNEGITPDILVEYAEPLSLQKTQEAEQPEIFEKLLEEETKRPIQEVYDNQLSRAIDLLKGILVYKGRE